MISIGLGHYLTVAAILFTLGLLGIFLNRKNVIVILMSIELMLNAANLAFVGFARAHGSTEGHIFVLMVIVVAAAEVAVGLGLVIALFRNRESVNVEDVSLLKW